jgi:hypothetical protein
MSKRIAASLLTLLVIVLSAYARETPAPASSVSTLTATPIPASTTTPTPTAETPEAGPCELVANTQTTVHQRPSLDADIFGTLSAGDRATVGATTADGWLGFDPSTAQAANVGVFRLRWLQRSDAISLEGRCQARKGLRAVDLQPIPTIANRTHPSAKPDPSSGDRISC